MRFQVDSTVLAGEAAQVASAARTLAGVAVPTHLGVLRTAVPGGSTAAAADGLTARWQAELSDLRRQVRSHAEALQAAAAGYGRVESAAQRTLGVTR